jgi:hypothetical protein
MKWFCASLLVIVNFVVILHAITPLYITFAELPVEGVAFEVGNKPSIDRALMRVRSQTIEQFRDFWSGHIWPLAWLAMGNGVLALILLLNRKPR